MPFDLSSVFSQEIKNLLVDSDEYNVIIHVGNGENVKMFQAHSLILRTRSSYYKTALSKPWAKQNGDSNILNHPDFTPNIFEIILNYIYSGTITLNDRNIMEVLEILVIADKLLLMDLLNFIQNYLIETESEWLHSYIMKIYQIAISYDSCSKLKDSVLNAICNDPKLIFQSSDFLTINESLLLPILECDNLDMPENEIWENVIKWGIFQINSDLSFTKTSEEFSALASTLSNCLPLIRFSQISNNDIYDKVWPFRAILPAYLEDDIIRCHLKVGSKPKYGTDSSRSSPVLITHRQLLRIAEWIDRKNFSTYTDADIPYKFKLLIRGTRDGFDSRTFHQCCDNKGPTIVVMKVACSSEIIGGYNPLKWKIGSERLSTKESFLFSFENGGPLENAKISRVSRSDYAINIKDESYGPCFGDKDLWMRGNFNQPKSCSAQKDDYKTLITKYHNEFAVSEYEVFEIFKT